MLAHGFVGPRDDVKCGTISVGNYGSKNTQVNTKLKQEGLTLSK